MNNIRNFCIIAHIDHGKSTLADSMLEITGTIEAREMRDQVLDSMELERERGITIKMQPVRMLWQFAEKMPISALLGAEYVLNLIDTPGHIDFSYEVSRALKAVEGAVLLVDATQGVQAQTLSVLNMAREEHLSIIPAVSKIDSPRARVDEVKNEISQLLKCDIESILEVSGKTGEGVKNLLNAIIERVPPPGGESAPLRALVFDFKYSTHRGVIVFVRLLSGEVRRGDALEFKAAKHSFVALEVGIFSPAEQSRERLAAGEIGYIVTGVKEPGIASVGDTIGKRSEKVEQLLGYVKPEPVVWASIYPLNQNNFTLLKQAFSRLRLIDSAFVFEEEASNILGKGFRAGFLGMLHLEIIAERLKREYNLDLIITSPSITYDVVYKRGEKQRIYSATFFPDDGEIDEIFEPMVKIKIITPHEYVGEIIKMLYEHEARLENTENFGDGKTTMECILPLRELMRNFFDKMKSVSRGYASLSYEMGGEAVADVTRLDFLINGEIEPAFSRVVSKRSVESEAMKMVERLHHTLPRAMIAVKIQAKAQGKILSSKTISALRKNVTAHMYGGDITRKMKLREKQKKGKKKMQGLGKVNIPQDVFIKMI